MQKLVKQGRDSAEIYKQHLRLLVDKIIITEKNKKLKVKIKLNGKFQRHKDCYDENGNLTEKAFIA